MVAARVIPATSKVPRAFDGARRALERLDALYAGGLARCLARPTTTVAVATALLLGSLSLYPWIGSEFLPPTDEGQVQVIGRMDIGTRLDLVDVKARELMARVTPLVPEAVASVVSVGGGVRRPQDAASARVQISLTPAAARDRSNVEIAAALRRGLEQQIPGMRVRVRAPQGSFVLQRLLRTEEGLSIEVRGYDLERLEEVAKAVASAAETVPGVTDAEVSRKEGVPQYSLHIDRDKAADLGLRPRDVAAALQTAVAGTEAGEFRTEGEAYRILVQLEEAHELKLERILTLGLPTPTGEAATLGALVRVEETTGPLVIERKDQQRMISVAVNVAGRDLGSVAEDLEARLRAVPRPQGYDLRLAGAFEEQKKSARELFFALALAVALVYMVLAAQYESLRDPLVVMVSVPLSAIGVLTLLYVTDTTLNVQSYLGCIMLGGIVVNNAILLVDQAGSLLAEGQPALRAVAEAG
ncbi:MAG: efflux RND transporter permease subunit, partial [Myxococcota bacterium]